MGSWFHCSSAGCVCTINREQYGESLKVVEKQLVWGGSNKFEQILEASELVRAGILSRGNHQHELFTGNIGGLQ